MAFHCSLFIAHCSLRSHRSLITVHCEAVAVWQSKITVQYNIANQLQMSKVSGG